MINPFKRLRPGSGEIVILIVIGVLALIVITGHHEVILRAIYSPVPGLIAIIMLIEYLILKGSDRSAIYRRELETVREKRRGDLLALRAMEDRLADLHARLDGDLADPEDVTRLRQGAEQARTRTEELLRMLRERV